MRGSEGKGEKENMLLLKMVRGRRKMVCSLEMVFCTFSFSVTSFYSNLTPRSRSHRYKLTNSKKEKRKA